MLFRNKDPRVTTRPGRFIRALRVRVYQPLTGRTSEARCATCLHRMPGDPFAFGLARKADRCLLLVCEVDPNSKACDEYRAQ